MVKLLSILDLECNILKERETVDSFQPDTRTADFRGRGLAIYLKPSMGPRSDYLRLDFSNCIPYNETHAIKFL